MNVFNDEKKGMAMAMKKSKTAARKIKNVGTQGGIVCVCTDEWSVAGVRVNELLYTTSVGQLAFQDRISRHGQQPVSLNNFPNIDGRAEFEKGGDTTRHTTSTMFAEQ